VWSSKDLALIIILAATSFVYSILLVQLPNLITGVVGLNYFFIFGHGIIISLSFLIYNGKRWRFAFQSTLLSLLLIPTFSMGAPFDVLARMPMLLAGFLEDLIFNSFHQIFKTNNKLMWWGIFVALFGVLLNLALTFLNMYLFYSPEALASFVTVITLLSPVVIVESVIGGYIGYEVFERIKKTNYDYFDYLKHHSDKLES
jgi:hypothetical protein